jgi:hypothetical protein
MCQRGTFTHACPSFYHPPPFVFRPLPPHLLLPRPLSAPPPPPAAVSVAAVSVAAVSVAAKITVSADIAAALWLIVVCTRCCLCFRVPPAAVCWPHCQCLRHRHRHCRPCSFRRHRCHRCLFFCPRQHCLYVSTFPTASMFQRFRRRGRRCLCFDRHRHHSSKLQVVWH